MSAVDRSDRSGARAAAVRHRPGSWAELVVLDLAAAERFYVDLLGLIVSERTPDALYLRGWEERPHHSLVLRRGPIAAACARLGFRVRADDDLDLIAADFGGAGCETSIGRRRAPEHGPRAARA